jgi:hypothetical protein
LQVKKLQEEIQDDESSMIIEDKFLPQENKSGSISDQIDPRTAISLTNNYEDAVRQNNTKTHLTDFSNPSDIKNATPEEEEPFKNYQQIREQLIRGPKRSNTDIYSDWKSERKVETTKREPMREFMQRSVSSSSDKEDDIEEELEGEEEDSGCFSKELMNHNQNSRGDEFLKNFECDKESSCFDVQDETEIEFSPKKQTQNFIQTKVLDRLGK